MAVIVCSQPAFALTENNPVSALTEVLPHPYQLVATTRATS